ncbi:hypothetical protein [Alloiococcus otitis]|uniref:hypothetical protein n=1 Tax=Alloiococcus otitis TaxID=1652 RepID=UPI0006879511
MKAENRESNLRPIQAQDIPAIEAIMGQEWYQDILQRDKEAGQACVHFDVQSCLNASSFGLVALVQGQVVGVIMARSDRDKLNLRLLKCRYYTCFNDPPGQRSKYPPRIDRRLLLGTKDLPKLRRSF